jgi:hypothetical protein
MKLFRIRQKTCSYHMGVKLLLTLTRKLWLRLCANENNVENICASDRGSNRRTETTVQLEASKLVRHFTSHY